MDVTFTARSIRAMPSRKNGPKPDHQPASGVARAICNDRRSGSGDDAMEEATTSFTEDDINGQANDSVMSCSSPNGAGRGSP